ncbi:MAG: radical SAM family heme chaperone HemW, partial [Bacteroidota bacterium]
MAGLYLHIPYCKQACHYCDFHFSTNLRSKPELVKALVKEIESQKNFLETTYLESIYFGGGTPSLLTVSELGMLFDSLQRHFVWGKDCEITLEANPDDIDKSKLKAWMNFGINRLSIGLQSFNDEELVWMNRAHNARESEASVKMSQDTGIENISIDLIYGTKFQNTITWESTLQKAIDLNCSHVSAYNLTIEGQTKLHHLLMKGSEPEVDEHLSTLQFKRLVERFAEAGLEQYEISNFAKAGKIAVHNTSYWFQKPYLGIGPSAHSYKDNLRQWNVKSNALYIQQISKGEKHYEIERLGDKDLYNEFILTRLRTKWGVAEKDLLARFGENALKHFKKAIEVYSSQLNYSEGVYQLNAAGKLLADGI